MTYAIDRIAEQSERIGYRTDAILRNYAFSGVGEQDVVVAKRAALAVFTQTPPSYRSAAFGVAETSRLGAEATVRQYRSLGAPLFFVVEDECVSVWQVYAVGPPRQIQRTSVDAIPSLFQSYREVWMPDAIHRAKSIGQIDKSHQLDFVDVGLIPALEGEIHERLDRLLRETLAATREESDDLNVRLLFQGVFRLLAAKVLLDRGHEASNGWDTSKVVSVLSGIEGYYSLPGTTFNAQAIAPDLEEAWRVLFHGVNVANVSADDLAFVYENTLVTPKTRRSFGTHSTPRHVAEYIVRRLGLWRDQAMPKVFEPFSGAGVFLVSALRHMREALPSSWDDKQRHDLLVNNIRGTEIDAFACEVATLSLILADYPNTNGWKIDNADLFRDDVLESRLAGADVILCNPPFEVFTHDERNAYPVTSSRSGSKAISVLAAVLNKPPKALGFVLPRSFLMDRAYRDYRSIVERSYGEVELVSLPDGIFSVSQIETALLIARDRKPRFSERRILSSEVDDCDRRKFGLTGLPSRTREELRGPNTEVRGSLWIPPLGPLWRRVHSLPTLGDYFSGHWGIRWKDGGQARAAVDRPGEYHKLGLLRVQDHRQFRLGRSQWIDTRPSKLYAGGSLRWDDRKILCNAARLSRGYWRLAAAVDNAGLVASQQFIGLWPKPAVQHIDFDEIVAVLNGPLASAFMTDHSTEKRFRIRTLLSIPIPPRLPEVVAVLAREYQEMIQNGQLNELRTRRINTLLDEIDHHVLDAYDLPPKLVRDLLAAFRSSDRPVAHQWSPWNIAGNELALTISEIRGGLLGHARGNWVQEELTPVSSKEAAAVAPYLP